MSENPCRTVVFDLGGVLLVWDRRLLYQHLIASVEERERFLDTVTTMEWNATLDAGRPFADAIDELIAEHPDRADLIRAYHERWAEMLGGRIEGSAEILAELAAAGVRLLALTNWSAETFPIGRAHAGGLFDLFEAIVVSGEEGFVKPDPRLFRVLLERHSVDPVGTVYIDDSPPNVAAAAALGFDAVHFTGPDQLRVELTRRGLLGAGGSR